MTANFDANWISAGGPFVDGSLEAFLSEIVGHPEKFFETQEENSNVVPLLKNLLEKLYAFATALKKSKRGLKQLNSRDFEPEQIWQLLKLRHSSQLHHFTCLSSHFVKQTVDALFPDITETEEPNIKEVPETAEVDVDVSDSAQLDFAGSFSEESAPKESVANESYSDGSDSHSIDGLDDGSDSEKKTASKDHFFRIQDMNDFVHEAEISNRDEEGSDAEEIDLFNDLDDDEADEAEGMTFNDFFDPLQESDVNEDQSSSDEEDVSEVSEAGTADAIAPRERNVLSESAKASAFVQSQEKIANIISKHEQELLAPKPWVLTGEVAATQRPQLGVLEEDLEFQHGTRPAPVITEETTSSLESIIKLRIKEESWDDVCRKSEPKPPKEAKSIELDHEKSQLGLAEIYAQKFLKETVGVDKEADQRTEKQQEVQRLFGSLCYGLDALTNFNFTPKLVEATIKQAPNVAAIRMEEAIPVSLSTSVVKAPEETYQPKRRPLKGELEVTSNERKSNRRAKKKTAAKVKAQKKQSGVVQKQTRTELLKKLKQTKGVTVVGNDNTHKYLKTSKSFFAEMDTRQKGTVGRKRKRKSSKSVDAKKFKL